MGIVYVIVFSMFDTTEIEDSSIERYVEAMNMKDSLSMGEVKVIEV